MQVNRSRTDLLSTWRGLLPLAALALGIYFYVWWVDERREPAALGIGLVALLGGLYSLYLEWRLGREIDTYDEEFMIACYRENEASFTQLGEMLAQDAWICRLDPAGVEPDGPSLSRQRERQYARLLGAIRTARGFARYAATGDTAFCFASGFGVPGGGASFGYAFSRTEPVEPVVERFNAKALAQSGVVFRRIRNGWYLFYRID